VFFRPIVGVALAVGQENAEFNSRGVERVYAAVDRPTSQHRVPTRVPHAAHGVTSRRTSSTAYRFRTQADPLPDDTIREQGGWPLIALVVGGRSVVGVVVPPQHAIAANVSVDIGRRRISSMRQDEQMDEVPRTPRSRHVVYKPGGRPPRLPLPGPFAGPYATHCLNTGTRLVLDDGPILTDYEAGFWSYDCPVCGENHRTVYGPQDAEALAAINGRVDIPVRLDLGELIRGQHVVIVGIGLRLPCGSVIHNEFVPGFRQGDRNLDTSWGLGEVSDDLGTDYDHGGQGGSGADPDGIVRSGIEILGNGIPEGASWLKIEVGHASRWTPPGDSIQSFTVDLSTGVARDLIAG
jgi:hypothetical protein